MKGIQRLSHSVWECKYHVVFIPKYRRKAIYGQIRAELRDVFRRLARQKESEIVEGHLSSLRQASLPLFGALGGMVGPAIIYSLFNWEDAIAMKGWAIGSAVSIRRSPNRRWHVKIGQKRTSSSASKLSMVSERCWMTAPFDPDGNSVVSSYSAS